MSSWTSSQHSGTACVVLESHWRYLHTDMFIHELNDFCLPSWHRTSLTDTRKMEDWVGWLYRLYISCILRYSITKGLSPLNIVAFVTRFQNWSHTHLKDLKHETIHHHHRSVGQSWLMKYIKCYNFTRTHLSLTLGPYKACTSHTGASAPHCRPKW